MQLELVALGEQLSCRGAGMLTAQFSLSGCFPIDWSFAGNSNFSLSLYVF